MTREERNANILLYVICTLEELVDKGLIEGPKLATKEGREQFLKLKSEGFSPTEDEMKWAIAGVVGL